jgi:hypothetical protein
MAKHTTRSGDADLANNPVYVDKLKLLMDQLVPKGAVQMDISFPPYWKAAELTGFRGIPLKLDESQKFYNVETDEWVPFARWHWKNTGGPLDCRRGAVDDGEIETVQPGRVFTTSAFAGLPLSSYIGFEMTIICKASTKLPANDRSGGKPRSFWVFETYVMPEVYARIESKRDEDMQYIIQLQRNADRLALEEMTRINAHRKLGSTIALPTNGTGSAAY